MESSFILETKGINPSRIVNLDSSKDDLTCSFCYLIVWDAVCCATCESHFCSLCIQAWLSQHSDCPSCRSNFQSHQIPRISKNILSRLKLSCSFESNGCIEPIDYFGIYDHESICEYKKAVCLNADCGLETTIKELKAHAPICPHLIVFCIHCNKQLKNMEKSKHENECPFRKVVCCFELCQNHLLAKDYDAHVLDCGFKIMLCSFCNTEVLKKELNIHENSCDERIVKCKGCGQEMKKKELEKHEEFCELIEIQCSLCEKYMVRKEHIDHDKMICIENSIILLKGKGQFYPKNENEDDNHEYSELRKKILAQDEEISRLKEEVRNLKMATMSETKNSTFDISYPDFSRKKIEISASSPLQISKISKSKTLEISSESQSISSKKNNIISMLALTEKLIFLGSDSGKLSLWSLQEDRQLGIISLFPSQEIKALSLFNFDAWGSLVELMSLEKNKDNISISMMGFWMISGQGNGDINIWDVEFTNFGDSCTFKKSSTIEISKNKISSIIDLEDQTHFACATYTKYNQIDIWDCISDTKVISIDRPHKDTISKLLLIEKKKKFISGSDDGFVKVWNLMRDLNNKIVQMDMETQIQVYEPIWSLSYMFPNRVIIALNNQNLEIWDLFTELKITSTNQNEEELGIVGDIVLISIKNEDNTSQIKIKDERIFNHEESFVNKNLILALHKEKIAIYDENLKVKNFVKQNFNEFKWGYAGSHILQILSAKQWLGEKNEGNIVKLAVLGQKGRKVSVLELNIF